MKRKEIIIDLLPEDFSSVREDPHGLQYVSPENCPVARAIRRSTNSKNIIVTPWIVSTDKKNYEIKRGFTSEDYDFVREKYQKSNHDTIYFITLIED
jgi:hypothetical protein